MSEERWRGKLFKNRWDNEELSKGCFAWLKEWRTCPSYTIAGVHESYQRLLPTKLYYHKKTRTNPNQDVLCRMCRKNPESVRHVLSGLSALAQMKYLSRHNAALKILFFELLKDLKMTSKFPPWYSPIQPKPLYENASVKAFWDAAVFAENMEVRANRVDVRIIDYETRSVTVLKMSC